jgi:nitroreductase
MKTATISKPVYASETIAAIYGRRSVRKYKDKPVSTDSIEKIIAAGKMAPSALNEQPWKFYILTQPEIIQAFSKQVNRVAAKKFIKAGPRQIIKTVIKFLHFPHGLQFVKSDDPVFHGAPVVIFITAPRNNEWAALDIGMCAQNMMLAARSLGLDTCPVGFGKYVEHTKLYPALKIPADEQVHIAIVLGYGDEQPVVHDRIPGNIFFINLFLHY